jgi:hypothetical protein
VFLWLSSPSLSKVAPLISVFVAMLARMGSLERLLPPSLAATDEPVIARG